MRLLSISVGTLVLLGFTLLGVRYWGLSFPVAPFEHPFWTADLKYVVRVAEPDEIPRLLAKDPQLAFWLDLQLTADNQFIVLRDGTLPQVLTPQALGDDYRGPRLSRYELSKLRPLLLKVPLLSDFLSRFPAQRFVLNVPNLENVHTLLLDALKGFPAGKQILIQSDTTAVIESIKKTQPLWLYGTSQAELMRLVSLDSIGLAPAAGFHGDVFISALKWKDRPAFTESAFAEIKRRRKKSLLGPLRSREDYEAARQLAPDGFLFESEEIFLSLLDQKAL